MTALALNYQELVQSHDNQVTTTSKIIADYFGKLHKDVLRKIGQLSLETPKVWYERNFTLIQIEVDLGQNRTRLDKAYEITKDGFVLLVMGFTGKKATSIKIEFIEAFNWMYERLHSTNSIQRKALTAACTKYSAGNMSISKLYIEVANHFGYDKPKDIPDYLLPDAVAYVYELILAKHSKPAPSTNRNDLISQAMWRYVGIIEQERVCQSLRDAKNALRILESSINKAQRGASLVNTAITEFPAIGNSDPDGQNEALKRAKAFIGKHSLYIG